MKNTVEVYFDNGGSATLQVTDEQYCHSYEDMEQLAEDIKILASGENTNSWDGNEWGERGEMEKNVEADRNGAGIWFVGSELLEKDDKEMGWANADGFFSAMKK